MGLPLCGGKVPDASYGTLDGQQPRIIRTKLPDNTAFDPNLQLPEPEGINLTTEMKELLRTDYSAAPCNGDQDWLRTFGNIVAEFKEHTGDSQKFTELWSVLEKGYPQIYSKVRPALVHLVNQAGFAQAPQWGAIELPSDGFYHRQGGRLPEEWRSRHKVKRDQEVAQIATILFLNNELTNKPFNGCSAVGLVKQVERDFTNYSNWLGLNYQYSRVSLEGNAVIRGENDEFAISTFDYSVVPMRQFRATLKEAFDSDGVFVTDYYFIHKLSKTVFFGSGRDTYITIVNSRGQFVALLIVTSYTCDRGNPWQLVRENLGNMKYWAELFRRS